MSTIKVNPFFNFSRVKVVKQYRDKETNTAQIHGEPDKRYIPVCYRCHHKVKDIHSWHVRTVRDLDVFGVKSYITIR